MTAHLTWLDLTAEDRTKVRRVLDLFNEQGTIDELGVGSLRDVIANTLFPGTSVLLTRLRYFLFIPWIYRLLEAEHFQGDLAAETRELESILIDALAESDDTAGIIGVVARASLARLASSAYWASIVQWGLFLPEKSQSWYHTHFQSLIRERGKVHHADDPGVIWTTKPTWHPRLPPAPEGFPWEASFALRAEEAEFLQGRIEERCTGSLLAWLAREGSAELSTVLWDEPKAVGAPQPIASTVELGRRFSLHMEGAPLLYNLILAEKRYALQGADKDQELAERYRAELAEWAGREEAEQPFEPDALWQLVARQGGHLKAPLKTFVEQWGLLLKAGGAGAITDDETARQLIITRERRLKGDRRARTVNQGRLLDWSGRVGAGRMQFRWPQVRQLLIDLHEGLGR